MLTKSRVFRAFRFPQTANHRIFRAALTVGLFSAFVKVIATLKELVVAGFLGRSDDLEAFLIAFLIPSFVVQLVASQFASAVIPTFIEVRENNGREAAQRLLSSVLLLTLAALTVVALFVSCCGPLLLSYIGSNFEPAKLAMTRQLFYWLLPYLIVNGMVVVWGAVLNAMDQFAIPALSSVSTPAFTCLCIALFGVSFGVWSMVAGTLIGALAEAVVLAYSLIRIGYRIEFRWYGMTNDVKQVARQYPPLFIGALLSGGGGLVDQAMAGMLAAGSIAAYAYGIRVTSLVSTFIAMSLSTAVVPYLSAMTARRDWLGCRHTLNTYSRLLLVCSIPLTLFLVVFAKPIVQIVFQHGAFTAADTDIVARVHVMYCLQLPFFAIGLMYSRQLSAMRRNDVLVYTGACSLVLDVIFNIIFMRRMGVAGIALSTSMFVFVSFAAKAWIVRRLLFKADAALAKTSTVNSKVLA
jgi:putative peptidoglycan lipid II flippase